MSENLYCEGNKRITGAYKDGWYRSFKGYPDMSGALKEYLRGIVRDHQKVFLFMVEYVTDDVEYASFLYRDLVNGIWKV